MEIIAFFPFSSLFFFAFLLRLSFFLVLLQTGTYPGVRGETYSCLWLYRHPTLAMKTKLRSLHVCKMQDALALCLTVNIYGSPGNSLVRHFETSTLTCERNYGDESPCNCAAWPKSVLNIRMEISITRQQTAGRLWLRLIQFH